MNVDEIMTSEELVAVETAVNVLLKKYNLPRKNPIHKSFKEIALGKTFKARDALEIILNDDPTYPGFREVLASGFVGWATFPQYQPISLGLMTHAILAHMDSCERAVGLGNHDLDLSRDIVSRYVLTGIDFLADIYDQLGGYDAFTRAYSPDSITIAANTEDKSIKTVIQAMTYLHHGADRFRDVEYDFAPSLNRAAGIFHELKRSLGPQEYGKKYVARSLLHRQWTGNKPALALQYAASSMRVKRKSFLVIMLEGNFSYTEHHGYIDEWLGRARFVSDHIFGKMESDDLDRTTMRLLGDIKPRPFKAPKITSLEIEIMNSQFNKRFRRN
ncbi:hypothetical protein DSM25558_2700 [Agrobacterium sp. DSM 25558]|uniref:hypothetical protein n=1 Tax=Agrobacterium sp. DSM 25558 TaxID=1907665 RepID=UPI000972405D|nr:hypothetical protein [Agrobacterium sp. DSM 25558]SCX20198.1 hypothetical protein DSM25558_2700 [Agrobacterium sp. DSM 25558]